MKYIYLFVLFCSINGFAQIDWSDFSGEDKAFLYHSARRTDNLHSSLFNLFEFTDSIPYIRDTLPDYSYIERAVLSDPDKLMFHGGDLDRKSDGILADLLLRLALKDLDEVLHYRNSTDEKDKDLKDELKRFEQFVLEEVPQKAVRTLNSGDYVLVESLQGYYTPSLTVSDKIAAIVNSGYSQLDQMLILNSIMRAQEKYVVIRLKELSSALGIDVVGDSNFLSAVGDGSSWSDLKGGIKTPYDKGLPDEKGLFKFIIEEKLIEDSEIEVMKVREITEFQEKTGANLETVVHVDVFGFHEERQTTIAIQRGGNSYVLYGKNEHRFVSPDSAYGEGTTYWRLMSTLEHVHIAKLKEDLYGKRGYEYQIDLFEKKIESTLLKIKKTEYRLDILRHTPEGKPKIKKKKIKKKNMGVSDQAGTGHPTSALSKLDKKRNIEQNRLLQLNSQLEAQKKILEKLKEDMEKAYITLVKYETKLDFMKKTMGYNVMSSVEDNGVYYFSDGARFDYRTQDFIFPLSDRETAYRVYHISFGKEVFSKQIEENFVHLNISNRERGEKYVLNREITSVEMNTLSSVDSLELLDCFNFLAEKGTKLSFSVVAGGIRADSKWELFRDSTAVSSPFDADKERLPGTVRLKAVMDAELNMVVTSFEDRMIPYNFSNYSSSYNKLHGKYAAINEVDFYSGIVAKQQALRFRELMISRASIWIKDEVKKARVIGKLKKIKVRKIYFEASKNSHKVPDYVE